ncbi:PP2C family protein-serine/threonine phosphatase [Baekduia sp. Peel2402]|uniref:PP2C family protein-serine/threonine phosphatase n=1 Tax=Baekduia sp. Peel2402 TaxID=3458296 RepID=UPI00403EA25E
MSDDLFEDAPCGYVVGARDGTIARANRAFADLVGIQASLLPGRRLQDLLTIGGRIYHETHYAPLLTMAGSVREIAVDFRRPDGTAIPVLLSAAVRGDEVLTIAFQATDRRRYERELVLARDREHAIAAELQRALLTGTLPEDPALDLGVAYLPAEAGLEVGGDWWDAFLLSERRIGLVVGDVVGRGLQAATTMGQLRSAVRALASMGLTPGPLLEALDAYARRHEVGRMTTVAYAEIDLVTGDVRWACAGHPPPAVAAADGVTFAWDGRSAPLDATNAPEPRSQGRLTLDPDGLLVLFTDGLFERVDRPLQQGLDALLAEIATYRAAPASELAEAVTRAALAGRRANDDACLLALRWTPAHAA